MAHSFRVGVVTPHGTSAGSNIVDSTSNVFTVGDLTIETGSNPETIDVFFERNDIDDSTVEIDVRYPAAIDDFGCNVTQQFSQTDTMYDDLTAEPYAIDTDYVQSSFTINDPQNEVYSFDCASETTPEINGKYVVTQTSFPFIEQANNFRLGEIIPTTGDFGGLDLITLIVIIVSMVGFSSKNPAAGIIISVMILGATSFFELITIPTTVIGAISSGCCVGSNRDGEKIAMIDSALKIMLLMWSISFSILGGQYIIADVYEIEIMNTWTDFDGDGDADVTPLKSHLLSIINEETINETTQNIVTADFRNNSTYYDRVETFTHRCGICCLGTCHITIRHIHIQFIISAWDSINVHCIFL